MLVQMGGASVGRKVARGPCPPRRMIWPSAGRPPRATPSRICWRLNPSIPTRMTRRVGVTVSVANGTGAGRATGCGRMASGSTTAAAAASTTRAAEIPRPRDGNRTASIPTARSTSAAAVSATADWARGESTSTGTEWR